MLLQYTRLKEVWDATGLGGRAGSRVGAGTNSDYPIDRDFAARYLAPGLPPCAMPSPA